MSIKTCIPFYLSYVGDGTTDNLTVSLMTAPVVVGGSGSQGIGFSLLSSTPSGVGGISSDDGQSVTPTYNALAKTLKIEWPNPPANGAVVTIYGRFEF